MAERKESEFHICICSKLDKLTLAEELGQSWRSISVCISFGDYKKMFEINKKDLLPLPNEIGNIPGNGESQVERDLEELEEEFQIQIVDVQSMAIPISPTTSNQFNNSNDQPIHVTRTEMNIKSEMTQTELDSEFEPPIHLEVSLLSTNSSFKIDKTELFSLPTETGNVPGNPVERHLEEQQEENNVGQKSESSVNIPKVSSSSKQDSDDPSVHISSTGRNSKKKRKRTEMEPESNGSSLPSNSASRIKSRPKVKRLSNKTSTAKIQNKLKKCPTCSKPFCNKYYLATHQKIMHSDEQTKAKWKYECDICSTKFLNSTFLNNHKLVHSKKKKFKCPGDLATHLKSHEKDSPFKCKMCDKVLSSTYHFECHFRTYTGEKHYQCQICDKSFAQNGNLKTHMYLVHSS